MACNVLLASPPLAPYQPEEVPVGALQPPLPFKPPAAAVATGDGLLSSLSRTKRQGEEEEVVGVAEETVTAAPGSQDGARKEPVGGHPPRGVAAEGRFELPLPSCRGERGPLSPVRPPAALHHGARSFPVNKRSGLACVTVNFHRREAGLGV